MSKQGGEIKSERLFDETEATRAVKVYIVVSGLGPTGSMTLPKFTELVAGLSQKEATPIAQEMVKAKIPMLMKDAHYHESDKGEISFTQLGVNVLLCIGVFETSEECVYRNMLVATSQITMGTITAPRKERA